MKRQTASAACPFSLKTDKIAVAGRSATEFDPILFSRLIDYYTVYGKDDVRVTFKNGGGNKGMIQYVK